MLNAFQNYVTVGPLYLPHLVTDDLGKFTTQVVGVKTMQSYLNPLAAEKTCLVTKKSVSVGVDTSNELG
jgi:hypothetical protein